MAELLEINTLENIQAHISHGGKVVVEFGAAWCGPCRQFLPHFQKFAKKHPEITCIKVDIDIDPLVVSSYGIQSVPRVVYYNAGVRKKELKGRTVLQLEKEI